MKQNILFFAAVGLAGGIGFRSFFYIETVVVFVTLAPLVLLFLVAVTSQRISVSHGVAVLICIAACVLGVWRFESVERRYDTRVKALESHGLGEVVIEGIVVRDIEEVDSGRAVFVRVKQIGGTAVDTVLRATIDQHVPLAYGDSLVMQGKLARPESFSSSPGRIFFYEEYLRSQGVTHTLAYAKVENVTRDSGFPVFRFLYDVKKYFIRGIETILPEPQAGLGEGLLLGEKHALGKSYEEMFRVAGIIHIIVLSGYNLAIVAEAVMRLLSKWFTPRMRVYVGIGVLCIFALAVGLSATVVRAAFMASLALVARAYGKTYIAARGLAIAACVMLLWNPYTLMFDPGFQLSFIATLGLIYISPRVEKIFSLVPERFGFREYMTSTLATQIAVTPLLLYSMGSVSIVALFANVAVLVVVPLTMLLVLVVGIVGVCVGSAAIVVGYPAYLLLSYILYIAHISARIPFASLEVPAFSATILFLMYGLLIATLIFFRRSYSTPIPRA